MTEKQFETKAIAYLRERGVVVKVPRSRFTAAGVSDLLVCFNGRFVAIELKRPKGGSYGVTAAQERFMRLVRESGGVAGVARSLPDIEAILGECL
jgi:Holliday junction resolvase